MHLHFLDPYRDRQSVIHALDPRVKLIFTLAFVLTMALLPVGAWPVYVLMLTLSLSIVVLSELGLKYVLKRSLLAIPFVSAAYLIAYPQTPVVLLVAVYGLGVISLVAARFVDIRYCGGQTADGAAATLGDWTKYVKTLLPLSALLLGAVWALRHFFVK